MSFADSNSDLYSTSVIALIYTTSCYIGPRYNGTRLYYCVRILKRDPDTLNIHLLTDQFHKSQTAPVSYPTILHSKQKCAHFCFEWSIVGYETSTFWDLWIRPITFLEPGHHCACRWPIIRRCNSISMHSAYTANLLRGRQPVSLRFEISSPCQSKISFFGARWFPIRFVNKMTSFKMTVQISWNLIFLSPAPPNRLSKFRAIISPLTCINSWYQRTTFFSKFYLSIYTYDEILVDHGMFISSI